jgi:hypothetical protein
MIRTYKDLVGLLASEVAERTAVGLKVAQYKTEDVPHLVSVVVNEQGLIIAAVPGVLHRIHDCTLKKEEL